MKTVQRSAMSKQSRTTHGNDFCDYIYAEIGAMLDSMDEQQRSNPALRAEYAMLWIRENARRFREEWDEESHRTLPIRITRKEIRS